MFRLRDNDTGLWYENMDEDGDIIWTGNKAQALVFPSDKREFWLDDDEVEIVELGEDEVMTRIEAPRLPGF